MKNYQERLNELEVKRKAKKEKKEVIEQEIKEIDEKIKKIKDNQLIEEARECKLILNDSVSMKAIVEAVQKGQFEYLKELSNKLSKEEKQEV